MTYIILSATSEDNFYDQSQNENACIEVRGYEQNMPYADREKQLSYMRVYMRRKRALDRIDQLKRRKQTLTQQYEEEPYLQHFLPKAEVGIDMDRQIEACLETIRQCEGLLKMRQNCRI